MDVVKIIVVVFSLIETCYSYDAGLAITLYNLPPSTYTSFGGTKFLLPSAQQYIAAARAQYSGVDNAIEYYEQCVDHFSGQCKEKFKQVSLKKPFLFTMSH